MRAARQTTSVRRFLGRKLAQDGQVAPRKRMDDTRLTAVFGALFLLGYLPGILVWRSENEPVFGAELAAWYADAAHYSPWAQGFAAQLAAAFLQLTLLLFCGFCVFGVFFISAAFVCRGLFLGLCAGGVYQVGGIRALLFYWLFNSLPDLLLLFLCLMVALYAARLAGHLYQGLLVGVSARTQQRQAMRRLLVRYLFAVLLAIPACAACSGLAALFAGVFL